MILRSILYIAAGFCLGGVLFSYHLPRLLRHVDVVAVSMDHNPGTANAIKYAGVPVGLLCLLMDMFKGFVPVYMARASIGDNALAMPLIMAAPVLGHAIAPLYPFAGGKAIATAFGVLIGLLPYSRAVWVLIFWYLFFSLVVVIHPNERRSVYTFLLFAACSLIGAVFTKHYLVAIGCLLVASVPAYKNYIGIQAVEHAQAVASPRPSPKAT